ncbi:hypothetical protein CH330_05885 [candidate division WOR-3 bacterium JGI_Cruoil_03_51_56]|uniref:Hcy-binding domain-containing protein n=1 Tax=candidate division WOR-3 bacterium JGI_Cruoil_03_51_56 TaxID=1973747 RepID=A0A235BT32_UNCW3|nr:MAG: hypothetical protein CH330_05885 [candidate division WOR-3 bacterium JGI_Cruoil_03_51_56]
MTLSRLLQENRVVLLDGAMGTELERRGFRTRLPFWSGWALLEAPELVGRIHADYVRAGAQIITANTFRTNPRTVARVGLKQSAKELSLAAIELAHKAIGSKSIVVAGSIAPVEDCYHPELFPGVQEARADFEEHAENLVQAGADLLLIETMNSTVEAKLAAQACSKLSVPAMVSFILRDDRHLLNRDFLEYAVSEVLDFRPSAVLINCTPIPVCRSGIKVLAGRTEFVSGCYPNIGHPSIATGWDFSDAVGPDDFARELAGIAADGARILGGCCGTTPAHIQTLAEKISGPDESGPD